MANKLNIGQRFGCWVVLKELGYQQKYLCRCDCGNENHVRLHDLAKGKTIMCRSCSAKSKSNGVGVSTTTEYNTWVHINQRCHNPGNKDYPNYGGRGIEVYPLWRESYEAFFMHIGKKPTPEHTIERIDVNKGYEPGNVMWATRLEQARNKRNTIRIEIDGEEKTIAEWVEDPRCSVHAKTIYKRLEMGWEPSRAILEALNG